MGLSDVLQQKNSQNLLKLEVPFMIECMGTDSMLSGRVSDSGARGRGFETYHRRVVSLRHFTPQKY